MMRTLLTASVGCVAATAASHSVVAYMGTGNCDGEDHTCVEGPAGPEQMIQPLIVSTDGKLVAEGKAIRTTGAPAWITTTGHSMDDGCLFATLANISMIFSTGSGNPGQIVPSGGAAPVYAQVTNNGRTLLVANYHGPDNSKTSVGASAASFEIGSKCELKLVDVKNHTGSSINPDRQGGAHVHSFVPVRDGLAYACDLGMDQIFTYAVGADSKLTELHRTSVEAGFGPRHLVQHPSQPYVYVVTEMGRSVLAYKQQDKGVLELLQTNSVVDTTLGNGTGSKAAEIAISPDGSLVFATNRGSQNTVTVFNTLANGKLSRKGSFEAPAFPRGMALVLGGKILVVGGQSQTEVWSYFVGKDGDLRLASKTKDAKLAPHVSTFATFEPYSPETVVV